MLDLSKQLEGKNIVVTRARRQASGFSILLRSYGARVISCPTIRLVPPENTRPLDRAIQKLSSYDWLIFTSVNGAEKFMERFKKLSFKKQLPPNLKTCAIGPATAAKMTSLGLPVTRISKEYAAESILKEFPRARGKKILIPRAADAREVLPDELRKRGADVDVIPVYKTVLEKSNFSIFHKWLKSNRIHCITFTSSSTVKNFFTLLRPAEKERIALNKNIQAASIGPITTQTLIKYGWPPNIVARKPTTKLLAKSIVKFYKEKKSIA